MKSILSAEDILAEVRRMPPAEQLRLLRRLAEHLEQQLARSGEVPAERTSLWGICSDLGRAPSAEEVDEVRRQLWGDLMRQG